jgi:hypothetical protein
MQLAKILFALSLLLMLVASMPAFAITTRVGSGFGVMVQPTSSYFLAAYSGFIDVATDSEGVMLRGTYVERPKFSSNGYIDQEYGYFGMVGTKLTKQANRGLNCYVGYGAMRGYLAVDKEYYPDSTAPLRTFRLPGPVVELEYSYSWRHLRLGMEQIVFTGLGDQVQLDARVAWPYNILLINAGLIW